MRPRRRSLLHLSFLMLAAFSVSGMGCPETILPPPPMELELADTGPYVTNIKIENGAGDSLYDGRRPTGGQITANPTPEQLDGTMTITRTYSDGSTKQQTLTYEAGQPVNIGYNSATGEYFVKPSPKPASMPQFYGGLTPALQFLNRPDTPLVRREQGGMVTGFVNGDNDSRNPQFNGRVGFKMDQPLFGMGRKWGLEFIGSYFSSSDEETRQVVSASGGMLAVFGPIGGGGFTTGNDILDLSYESDYTAWNIQPRLSKSYNVGPIYGRDVRMNSYLGFNYGKNEDDQSLSGTVNGVGDFSTMNWIDSWYYGPEAGFYSAWDLCGPVRLTAGGFVNFNVNELSAKRMLTSTFGQEGQDEFSDTEYTVGGGVNVGMHYKVSGAVSARVGFQWERQSNTPVININQDTGVPSVDAEGSDAYQFRLGVKINY